MPGPNRARPSFSKLSEPKARALLLRNHVGRLCFIRDGQPDVTPVHYVSDGKWIFIRSAPGAKMEAFAHHPYVAFEVDETSDTFDWRSVVARGTIYVLPGNGTRTEKKELDRAIRALRSFAPESFTEYDPTPARRIVYGVHVDELTGRVAKREAPGARRAPRPVPARPRRDRRAGTGT